MIAKARVNLLICHGILGARARTLLSASDLAQVAVVVACFGTEADPLVARRRE